MLIQASAVGMEYSPKSRLRMRHIGELGCEDVDTIYAIDGWVSSMVSGNGVH